MDAFAEMCERVASRSNHARKLEIVSAYLNSLGPEERALALQLLKDGPTVVEGGSLFAETAPARASVSHALLRDALSSVCEWDAEILRASREAVEDAGQLVALLMQNQSRHQPMSLSEAAQLYQTLSNLNSPREKRDFLGRVFVEFKPLTVKYWIRLLTGNLRIGLTGKHLEQSSADVHTITAVITACEPRRGYTVGVRSGEIFVNVATVPAVLPDQEIEQIAALLRRGAFERYGRSTVVEPKIMLEIGFTGVSKNARRKGGYVLESPRLLGWLRDKRPEDCDELARIEAICKAIENG